MAPPISVNADLFTTNRPPTDGEYAQLTQYVQGHKTRLSELDERISRLRKELEALEEERDTLVAEAAPVMQGLAPIRRVPEDILREIFVACLNPYRNPIMSNTEAPVLLTQISSDLRRVALTTPALWAAIHIVVVRNAAMRRYMSAKRMAEMQQVMERIEQAVHDWLLRSGSLPLSISVYEKCDLRAPGDIDSGISAIMAIICKFALRWETLHFSCFPESLVDVFGLGLDDIPLVKSFTFKVTEMSLGDEGAVIAGSKILSAPMLTNLGLNFTGDISCFEGTVAWSQLTHLHLPQTPFWDPNAPTMYDVGLILRQTTCLISCNVSIYNDVAELDAIHLPCLKVLTINDGRGEMEDTGFLAAIRAPVLDIVSYNMERDILNRTHPLIELLKHSPSVTELAMGSGEKPSHIINCLMHCPELRTLHIQLLSDEIAADSLDEKVPESAVLDALAPDKGCLSVCPKLENFRWRDVLNISPSKLQQFLEKKRHSDGSDLAKWKTVVMEFMVRPDNWDIFIDIQYEQLGRDTNLNIRGSFLEVSRHSVRDGITQLDPIDTMWPSKIPQSHLR